MTHMTLNPIPAIEKLINEHGSAVILKERIELAKDQFGFLQQKNISLASSLAETVAKNKILERQNADLEEQVAQLQDQLEIFKPVLGGLVESMGALWRRTATGFEPVPYCRECKTHPIMTSFANTWICNKTHQVPSSIRPPNA
jgi:hypothetical protein